MKRVKRAVRVGLASAVLVAGYSAKAVDYSSGTNAVTTIANSVNASSDILLPVGIGLTLVFACWGLAKKFGRKAGASS